MKHLFIINPVAGKGKTLRFIPQIERIFEGRKEEYFIEVTKGEGHATEIVRSYTEREAYRVFSIGGDGTLNEVVNGMELNHSILGVIPSGSGNDFIRNIYDFPQKDDILVRTINGSIKKIDIGRSNQKRFINIASIGIDSEVNLNANRFKKIPIITGSMAYVMSIFATIFKYKSKNLRIQIDDRIIEKKALLVAVANGKSYGGGMKVAPMAKIDDGVFDICLVEHMSVLKILILFPKLIRGKHDKIKEVSFYKGKKICISSVDELTANMDGEVTKLKSIGFEIMENGITVLIPE